MGITELNTLYCFYKSPLNSRHDSKVSSWKALWSFQQLCEWMYWVQRAWGERKLQDTKMAFTLKRLQMSTPLCSTQNMPRRSLLSKPHKVIRWPENKYRLHYADIHAACNAQQHYAQISFTVFHPNQSMNVESKKIKICVLLGFYAAYNCNFYRRFGTTYRSHLYRSRVKVGLILFPETSVRNYHSTLHKFQKSADLTHTSAEAWNYDINSHKPLNTAGLRLLLCPISRNSLSHFTFLWAHSIAIFIQMGRRKSKARTEWRRCNFSIHGFHWTLFLGTPNCSTAVDGYLSYWIAAKSVKKYVLQTEIDLHSEIKHYCH
jgi:hypothetical protein